MNSADTSPSAGSATRESALPATTDYWVNDATGEPLFVVTAEANAGLCKRLPPLRSEVRALVGERRVTIVFDRGGWSPKLFHTLIGQGFDILTYRKGLSRRVPRKRCATLEGREVRYTLADQGIRLLGGRLRLRQVTRLSPDGDHQTPVVTSRRDLPAIEVAFRMFERWRQENFFKYLREEYALEARRATVPRRVPVAQTLEEPVVRLATERKHISNVLKMVAYQVEGELLRRLVPHYHRAQDEGRTLVQTALAAPGDLLVTADELRVTLAPLRSPHRSRALAALCEELNRTGVRFPGTRLRLRYAVAQAEGLSRAAKADTLAVG